MGKAIANPYCGFNMESFMDFDWLEGELEPHPLADFMPLMDEDSIKSLIEDIKVHGLREPIVLYEGKVLDGRNRLTACRSAGIEPRTTVYTGDFPGDYVVSLNLERRHLTTSQKAMIGARIATLSREDGFNQWFKGAQKCAPTKTGEAAAALLGVSRRAVVHAKQVVGSGSDDLKKAVETGRISVTKGAEVAKTISGMSDVDKGRIVRAAAAIKRDKKSKRAAARIAVPADMPRASKRYKLHVADMRTTDIIANESIDSIITDPPYPKEHLELFSDLARRSVEWLKPGGSLIVMSGQAWLPEVIRRLCRELQYQWTLSYLTPGGQAVQVFDRRVNTFWKPLLWFVKGEYSGDWIGDVARSKVNDNDKHHHHWGQAESGMIDIVERMTKPGDVILDPFCGAGTTGVAAVQLHRYFVGLDLEDKHIASSAARLGSQA